MFWRFIKTAIFSFAVPGTVGFLVPQYLKNGAVLGFRLLSVVGLVLLCVGASIYLGCAWDFVVKGLGTPAPIAAPRVLVVNGLYRFTRNPMYVGVSILILGQAICYLSTSITAYLACVIVGFNLFVTGYEEPTLRRLFGEQYQAYCRKVPRWIFPLPRA